MGDLNPDLWGVGDAMKEALTVRNRAASHTRKSWHSTIGLGLNDVILYLGVAR